MKIKVAIIDDEQILIDGLRALLSLDEAIEVIGWANDQAGTLQLLQSHSPDVVLMDLSFPEPEPDGIEMTHSLLQQFPDLKVLMLTSYDDIMLIKEALRKGAQGYVLKNIDKEELVNAIKTVASGKRYLGQDVQNKVIDELLSATPSPNTDVACEHPLTDRELQIARLIASGKKRKEIAQELFLSTNTVDTHIKNTFGKLEVNNVAALIGWLNEKQLL